MPLDLKQYKGATRPVAVAVGTETLNLSYRPASFTPNLRKEIARLSEDDADALAKYLLPLLASWDLTDAGKPVEITLEILNDLGYQLLNAIFGVIIADVNPASDPNAPKT